MPIDFSWLETLALIKGLRFSRWAYAAVNATHILGIALLIGGAVPMALRLFGLWPQTARADLVRVLKVTTGSGLCLALATGFLLFATRANEYAGHPAFQVKLLFVAAGIASALIAHARHGRTLDGASQAAAIRIAAVTIVCWLSALTAGRLIAFIEPAP